MTFRRLGDSGLVVSAVGLGTNNFGMKLDLEQSRAVLDAALDAGITLIDTADSYGPGTSEETLSEALFPYPEGLVIGTKVGQSRPSRDEWRPLGRPEYIRQQAELSLRRLRLDRIDLFQLHRIDPKVDRDEQFAVLADLQREGKVRALGLSQVSVDEIVAADGFFAGRTVSL